MILIALRILFGAALAYGFSKIWQNEQTAPQTGDLANAFYLALCVILSGRRILATGSADPSRG